MKIKQIVEGIYSDAKKAFVDSAKINNVARTAYDNFAKIMGANNINVNSPGQPADAAKYIPYAQGYALQFMAAQESNEQLKKALTTAINAVPVPTTFDKASLQQYFKTAAQMRAAVKNKAASSLPMTPDQMRKAELLQRMDQAKKEAELEKLKKSFSQGFTDYDKKTTQVAQKAVARGDIPMINPTAQTSTPPPVTGAPAGTEVKLPGSGLSVIKGKDGNWYPQNGDPAPAAEEDVPRLEKLAKEVIAARSGMASRLNVPYKPEAPVKKTRRRGGYRGLTK